MRDFGLVLQQAGGIVVGLGMVIFGGYLLWLILTKNIENPTMRRLAWTVLEIILVVITLRFVAPHQATKIYQGWRDWWINVPSRDVGVLFNNLGTALGADNGSDYRPLETLPQSAPAPSGATQQDSYAPLEQIEPSANAPQSSDSLMPRTGRAAGEMMGGAVLSTCSDNDCPNGQCPEGCRANYTWIHGSGRYGRICNASEPNQRFAWLRVNVLDAAWANAFACPSIR